MRRIALGLAALLVTAATPAGTRFALAHGGQYRGPAGEVPPDSRTPADPPPPDTGGNTPTPPDGGGSTPTPPPGGGGTPTPPDGGGGTPDGSGDPSGGPAGGPSGGPRTPTGRLPARRAIAYESWLFWWNHNKDGILGDAARKGDARYGSSITVLVDSGDGNGSEPEDLTARAIEARVVPLLRRYALDDATHPDLRGSALLALAKMGRREMLPLWMRLARSGGVVKEDGQVEDAQVEETAVLSLGVLQDRSPPVRAFLASVARDGAARLRTRCFAAFALGLLGERDAAPGSDRASLEALTGLVRAPDSPRDLRASALVGLGLLGDPSALPDLLRLLDTGKAGNAPLDDLTLSYAAAALGKIGRPGLAGPGSHEVVDGLASTLLGHNRFTRSSAVIALGQVAPRGDEKVQASCVRTLGQVVRSGGKDGVDLQTANFALVALGRAAGGACAPTVRDAARRDLVFAFQERPKLRPFAALGLGLLGKDLPDPERAPLAEILRDALPRSSGDPEPWGAMALALGLLRDPASKRALESLVAEGKDPVLRGAAAVALGLLGDRASIGPVHAALVEKGARPQLRVDCALAAGLLRDAGAVPFLVELLQSPQITQFAIGSAATAIGRIGDQRAVEPLAGIVEDHRGQYQMLTRALAAVALGQIGDRRSVPVLALLSEDVNYRAYFGAMGEVLTIL